MTSKLGIVFGTYLHGRGKMDSPRGLSPTDVLNGRQCVHSFPSLAVWNLSTPVRVREGGTSRRSEVAVGGARGA